MEKERKVSLSKDATPRLVMTLAVTLTLLLFSQSQSWAQEASKSNFYLKGILGAGMGSEEVHHGTVTTEGEEVMIRTGGGFNIEGALGYLFTPTSMVEIALGYQSVGENPPLSNGDGSFKRFPLTATYIHQLPGQKTYRFYLGGGGGIYLSPELYSEWEGHYKAKCKYDSSFGYHGLVGVSYKRSKRVPYSFFGELKYVGGVKYKFKEGTWNGTKLTENTVLPEWKEFSGNQFFFNAGVRHCF